MSAIIRIVAPQWVAFEGVDLVDFLNQQGPAGLVPGVDGLFDDDGCRRVTDLFSQPSYTRRAVGIVAVIADQVLVLVGDVVHEQPQPLQCQHRLVVAFHGGMQL